MQVEKNITISLNNREVELLHQLTEFARIHIESKREPGRTRSTWAAHLTLCSEVDLTEIQTFMDKIFDL